MFEINDDSSIAVTRGDICFFDVTATENGEPVTFAAGDLLRIKVYERKNPSNVVMQKDFSVDATCESINVFLSAQDTGFSDTISKPTVYWYEIVLNPDTNPQTLVGYDEDGAKTFTLYPDGFDTFYQGVTPIDVGTIDLELNGTSEKAIANKAVYAALARLESLVMDLEARVLQQEGTLWNLH